MENEKLKEELEYVLNKAYNFESFDYAFSNYIFKEVKDEQFHILREKYVAIHNELDNYIKNKYVELGGDLDTILYG